MNKIFITDLREMSLSHYLQKPEQMIERSLIKKNILPEPYRDSDEEEE